MTSSECFNLNLCFQLEISYLVYVLLYNIITFQRQTCLVTAVGTGSSFAGNIVPIMIFITVLFFTKMPCFVKKKMIKDIYTASERERALCHLATHLLLVQYNTSFCCSVFRLLYFILVSCTYSTPLYYFVTMSARLYLFFPNSNILIFFPNSNILIFFPNSNILFYFPKSNILIFFPNSNIFIFLPNSNILIFFPNSNILIFFPNSNILIFFPNSNILIFFPNSNILIFFPNSNILIFFPNRNSLT